MVIKAERAPAVPVFTVANIPMLPNTCSSTAIFCLLQMLLPPGSEREPRLNSFIFLLPSLLFLHYFLLNVLFFSFTTISVDVFPLPCKVSISTWSQIAVYLTIQILGRTLKSPSEIVSMSGVYWQWLSLQGIISCQFLSSWASQVNPKKASSIFSLEGISLAAPNLGISGEREPGVATFRMS